MKSEIICKKLKYLGGGLGRGLILGGVGVGGVLLHGGGLGLLDGDVLDLATNYNKFEDNY